MNMPLSVDQQTERAIHEFESDLRHYESASRRSLVLGLLALFGAISATCLACGGLLYLVR
jgi:hypothetical protein